MIQHFGQLPNPAMTVIEDLILRSGYATEQSLSPYDGMHHLIDKVLYKTKNLDYQVVLKMMSDVNDYDARRQHPVKGKYHSDSKANNPTNFLLNFEDIDVSWVENYVKACLKNLNRNSSKFHTYITENEATQPLIDSEDGELIDAAELLIEEKNDNLREVSYAKAKLPYLLKRMHQKSLELKVSVMSLLIQLDMAAKKGVSLDECSFHHIQYFRVYRMQPDGNLGKPFTRTANNDEDKFRPAFDWARGKLPDEYYADALELRRVCDILRINLSEEDPFDFQAADIERMTVRYITKNRDYLRGVGKRNLDVLQSLSTVRTGDYGTPVEEKAVPTTYVDIMQLALDSEIMQKIMVGVRSEKIWKQFFSTYAKLHSDFYITARERAKRILPARMQNTLRAPGAHLVPDLKDFVVRNGFLYRNNDSPSPIMFDMSRYVTGAIETPVRAIAHISGVLLLLSGGSHLYYLDIECVCEYMEDVSRNFVRKSYKSGKGRGAWKTCST